jgi:hypothetical protein
MTIERSVFSVPWSPWIRFRCTLLSEQPIADNLAFLAAHPGRHQTGRRSVRKRNRQQIAAHAKRLRRYRRRR